ncbi:MAG TPA: hypothetical protein VF101_00450 [Gaiellaceae bacterium]
MTDPDVDGAARFLAGNARVLDRRRFERLFWGGDARPVRDAVAAFRNPDGGFGHALEPDGRTPASQPAAIAMALATLDEADAWDEELVAGACEWLAANAPEEGGATFVEPSVEGWPHAPWWEPEEGRPASLLTTGLIAGTLHARHVDHPWLDRATDLLWRRIEGLDEAGPYAVRGLLHFLQHVPDRDHAEHAFGRVEALLLDGDLVALDPEAEGEVRTPLDFAPNRDSIARRLFDQPTIEAHLDHLAGGQGEDGGWSFNWSAWSPVATSEWRGSITVDALRVLRANGRL